METHSENTLKKVHKCKYACMYNAQVYKNLINM